MERRDFLKLAAASGLGLVVLPHSSRAQEMMEDPQYDGRLFINLWVGGG